jgi:uncharacterized membrane protein YidH (DUF202 family)
MTYTYVDDNEWRDVQLTEAQEKVLDVIEINPGDEIVRVYYYFDGHDGASYAYYVPESLLGVYNAIAKGDYSGVRVVVNRSTRITRDQLNGDAIAMTGIELFQHRRYNVFNSSPDAEMEKHMGHLVYDLDGSCYYLDFAENGIESNQYCALDYESFVLHKITDESIIGLQKVETSVEKDPSFVIAMTILLLITFVLIPVGVVAFLATKIKKEDGLYKKLFGITIILGVALIVISVILAFMVIPYI